MAAAAAAGGKEKFDAVCKMASWLSRLHTILGGCGRNNLISYGLFRKWDYIGEFPWEYRVHMPGSKIKLVLVKFLKFERKKF